MSKLRIEDYELIDNQIILEELAAELVIDPARVRGDRYLEISDGELILRLGIALTEQQATEYLRRMQR